VFFTAPTNSSAKQYCFAADIDACAAELSLRSANACCPFLLELTMPGAQISEGFLVFNSVVVPMLALVAASYWQQSEGELTSSLLGFILTFNLNLLLTEFAKHHIGYPRPNFHALSSLVAYNASAYAKLEKELFTNMPSGHSSMQMGSMLYLSFYFHAKLLAHLPLQSAQRQLWLALSYSPVLVAVWTAATRLQDYWHSNAAVVLGLMFGSACATFGWGTAASPYLRSIWRSSHESA
jgi:membrane-associated phospholipid phosphatase